MTDRQEFIHPLLSADPHGLSFLSRSQETPLIEISEKVALCCSKYFFDHSKVRFTTNIVNTECTPQNRMTAALQHCMILCSELPFPVFQGSLIFFLTVPICCVIREKNYNI